MEIISRDEAIASGLRRYFTGLQCSRGHVDERLVSSHTCISCLSANSKKYRLTSENAKRLKSESDSRYYELNKEAVLARNKQRRHLYAASKNAKAIEKRRSNPEADREYRRLYREKNPEKAREWSRLYAASARKKNPHKAVAYMAERRVAKKRSTPTSLSQADRAEIFGIYQFSRVMSLITGKPWHVDHVVPLSGQFVSGLHVPSNLRAIPATENMQKSNKLVEELLSA